MSGTIDGKTIEWVNFNGTIVIEEKITILFAPFSGRRVFYLRTFNCMNIKNSPNDIVKTRTMDDIRKNKSIQKCDAKIYDINLQR